MSKKNRDTYTSPEGVRDAIMARLPKIVAQISGSNPVLDLQIARMALDVTREVIQQDALEEAHEQQLGEAINEEIERRRRLEAIDKIVEQGEKLVAVAELMDAKEKKKSADDPLGGAAMRIDLMARDLCILDATARAGLDLADFLASNPGLTTPEEVDAAVARTKGKGGEGGGG